MRSSSAGKANVANWRRIESRDGAEQYRTVDLLEQAAGNVPPKAAARARYRKNSEQSSITLTATGRRTCDAPCTARFVDERLKRLENVQCYKKMEGFQISPLKPRNDSKKCGPNLPTVTISINIEQCILILNV